MARRYELNDAQREKLKPYLGNIRGKTGRPSRIIGNYLTEFFGFCIQALHDTTRQNIKARGKPCINDFLMEIYY